MEIALYVVVIERLWLTVPLLLFLLPHPLILCLPNFGQNQLHLYLNQDLKSVIL